MNTQQLKNRGFTGFLEVNHLCQNLGLIPKEKGVYVTLIKENYKPIFLKSGVGGFFKNKNPNVDIHELKSKWIENAEIVYVSRAGGKNSSATLRSRLKQYFDFGTGKNVGHYGGRYVWQLEKNQELIITWKVLKTEDPFDYEKELLNDFIGYYGQLPFANLR